MDKQASSRKSRKQAQKRRNMLFLIAGAGAVIALALVLILMPKGDVPKDLVNAATTMPEDPMISPTVQPTPAPITDPNLGHQELGEIVSNASIQNAKLKLQQQSFQGKKSVKIYQREDPIQMGPGETYTDIEGVLTFRGNNYRDNAAYGLIPDDASKLNIKWSVSVGHLDEWAGVGWTGQASIVRWPEETRAIMNIKDNKKQTQGLTEVIIGALDGKIRFIDLEDGQPTRNMIDIKAPIKGSVSVDPRGYPMLYCGQGLFEVGGKKVQCGTRVFSLIDGKVLFYLTGDQKRKLREWYCFDAAPLIDGATDTMMQLGENGLISVITLNTDYDPSAGTISLSPQVDQLGYKSAVTTRAGMENSIAVYNHYGYFADNSGLLCCFDLNTLKIVWATPTGDDTDATCAIEETDQGVFLYTANEVDLRGKTGDIQMRCYNALTGEALWKREVYVNSNTNGGAYGSPAIGKGGIGQLVYFNIARTSEGGTLFALDKTTGKVVWKFGLGHYSWSTPLILYDSKGKGYILIGDSGGQLRLMDGLNGDVITSLDLKQNIEASPSAFENMAIVSTRGGKIFGIEIN
ncbi:PQQ-binding-like beta-propeller repeat protein [Eubacteriales bacterium OttesenSCG-928-N13]|nr:PQQ-binding-like beta-propeller repeat protein [Eubacteriales bacterium OttesenSCG-928-N13]